MVNKSILITALVLVGPAIPPVRAEGTTEVGFHNRSNGRVCITCPGIGAGRRPPREASLWVRLNQGERVPLVRRDDQVALAGGRLVLADGDLASFAMVFEPRLEPGAEASDRSDHFLLQVQPDGAQAGCTLIYTAAEFHRPGVEPSWLGTLEQHGVFPGEPGAIRRPAGETDPARLTFLGLENR